MKKVIAIVPAAGFGTRFGNEQKSFFSLLGKPLLIWSLEALQSVAMIEEIVPVVKENELTLCAELVDEYSISKVKKIVPGGKERQDSVCNGLNAFDEVPELVAIHDGVRPLVDKTLIEQLISSIKGFDGVIPAVPVKDTIKEARAQSQGKKEFIVQRTLNRDQLRAVQTPQVFYFEKIKNAYDKAYAKHYYATDDAALIERYGGVVKVIMGSYRNLKITTPEDIRVAEAMLRCE